MKEIEDAIKDLNETENKVELCFTKKYRNDGRTIYSFYRGIITKDLSDTFKYWIINNLEKANSIESEIEPFSLEIDSEVSSILLDEIDNWHHFAERAFMPNKQENTNLEKIKTDLNNFILYLKTDKHLIGQIRILHSKSILNRDAKILTFLNGENIFSSIEKERKGIEIDESCDFSFIIGNPTQLGLVINRTNFISIFDLNEQNEKDAMNIVSSANFYNSLNNGPNIINMVKRDRIFQKMINNPVCRSGFAELTLEDLILMKQQFDNKFNFIITEDGKIDFENGKEKEGFKDLICCLGHRYTKSLTRNHLLEGIPKKFKQ